MVFERPPSSDMAMEVEPLNEVTPTKSTPGEATPVRATPEADTHTEERHDDTSPVEEATPGKHYRATPLKEDSRDQPAANVVERQIGGKTFKLGRLLSQAEQDEVVEVISRHLYAFAWSASEMPGVPTRSSGVMTCLARARVRRAQWNAVARKDEWLGSGHSRRSVDWHSPISSVRNQRSPELRRSRRVSQRTSLRLSKAQKGNSKRVSSVRRWWHQLGA